jgi:hypothetical protein
MAGRGGLIFQEQIWTAESWAKPEHMDVRVYNPNSLGAICPLRASRFALVENCCAISDSNFD